MDCWNEGIESADLGVDALGPNSILSIQPDPAESGRSRGYRIPMRVVSDIHDLLWCASKSRR
jgi:hypothetical protein